MIGSNTPSAQPSAANISEKPARLKAIGKAAQHAEGGDDEQRNGEDVGDQGRGHLRPQPSGPVSVSAGGGSRPPSTRMRAADPGQPLQSDQQDEAEQRDFSTYMPGMPLLWTEISLVCQE